MEIVLIGAGPRGLVATERLIERQKITNQFEQLNITLVDPFGIGGRVWQMNQSHDLIMNTNPDHITLFTDNSSNIDGPIVPGPNLFEWSQGAAADFINSQQVPKKEEYLAEIDTLQGNGYASRGLFGVYLNWFFQSLTTRLTKKIKLQVVIEEALAVTPQASGDAYVVTTSNRKLVADNVVMALGHCENKPTNEQIKLRKFAQTANINYIYPTQPQEYDFHKLDAGEALIIRGLGLSFFDAVAMLTSGRGGKFVRGDDGYLSYQASGKEPQIIAGSRLGVPLKAKGRNEKKNDETSSAHFFTPTWFKQTKANGGIAGAKFVQLAHHETEYVYYERLIQQKYPQIDVAEFLHQFVSASDPAEVVKQSKISLADYFDWDRLMNPAKFMGDSADPKIMAAYLKKEIDTANEGTKTGPLAAALEAFHDIRDTLRRIVDLKLLSPADYQEYFLGQFNYENSHLSVGPPAIRIDELRALVLAGVVTMLGPDMAVNTDAQTGKFVTWSNEKSQQRYEANYLLEARLPSIKVEQSQNPLLQRLLANNLAQPHELVLADGTRFKTGALNIDSSTEQLMVDNKVNQHLFVWGIPTEGKQWFTTATPRPYINDLDISFWGCDC